MSIWYLDSTGRTYVWNWSTGMGYSFLSREDALNFARKEAKKYGRLAEVESGRRPPMGFKSRHGFTRPGYRSNESAG